MGCGCGKESSCGDWVPASCVKFEGEIPDWLDIQCVDNVSMQTIMDALIKKVGESLEGSDVSDLESCFSISGKPTVRKYIQSITQSICDSDAQ